MEVKEAVKTGKAYLTDLLSDEGMMNLGLEEIDYDDVKEIRYVTLGFSRPWNTSKGPLATIAGDTPARRAYKVLTIRDSDGKVLSVKRPEMAD